MSRVINRSPALLAIALWIAVTASSCVNQPQIDQLPAEALIVDVRTTAEFRRGHFPGAKNIPLSEIETRLAEFGPKDRPVVVYCRSGRRSSKAKDFLQKAGYGQVINGGGLEEMLPLAPKPPVQGETTP